MTTAAQKAAQSETVLFYTRYALTEGIKRVRLRAGDLFSDRYVGLIGATTAGRPGKDLFATLEEALAAAEAMRKRKIASLRKSITKLEGMAFNGC